MTAFFFKSNTVLCAESQARIINSSPLALLIPWVRPNSEIPLQRVNTNILFFPLERNSVLDGVRAFFFLGGGHLDPEVKGGGGGLRASVWSKNKEGSRSPGSLPWIRTGICRNQEPIYILYQIRFCYYTKIIFFCDFNFSMRIKFCKDSFSRGFNFALCQPP